ncbi:MAG: phosphoribosylglycinamide formyltransferase [Bdellovibrionales bacterium]|nr:phosphoribosylglycinamide formyltransferase [Bdellovibrionales bacterium]
MPEGFQIAVLISGRGSNLEQIIQKNSDNYEIIGVFSNRSDAEGIGYAKRAGLKTFIFPRRNYSSGKDQKKALYDQVNSLNPDLIILAGYMQILEGEFVRRHLGKIINIHPSLLPAFPGLSPHRQALEAGAREHGCTVHLVTEEVDAGPIIAQVKLEVLATDSETTLAARVLELEHRVYPWCIDRIGAGEILLSGASAVAFSDSVRAEAAKCGFLLPEVG